MQGRRVSLLGAHLRQNKHSESRPEARCALHKALFSQEALLSWGALQTPRRVRLTPPLTVAVCLRSPMAALTRYHWVYRDHCAVNILDIFFAWLSAPGRASRGREWLRLWPPLHPPEALLKIHVVSQVDS
jgi:hypothetical protein